MKNQLKIRFIFLALIGLFLSSAGFQDLYAQTKVKKNKVRLKVNYFKIVDEKWYCFYYLLSGGNCPLSVNKRPR